MGQGNHRAGFMGTGRGALRAGSGTAGPASALWAPPQLRGGRGAGGQLIASSEPVRAAKDASREERQAGAVLRRTRVCVSGLRL